MEYMAIDFAFGNNGTGTKLTQLCLNSSQGSSAVMNISKTFRDACSLSGLLQQRYIWGDSLCISQSDDEEVMSKKSNMAHTYRQAMAVISPRSRSGRQRPSGGLTWGQYSLQCRTESVAQELARLKKAFSTLEATSSFTKFLTLPPMLGDLLENTGPYPGQRSLLSLIQELQKRSFALVDVNGDGKEASSLEHRPESSGCEPSVAAAQLTLSKDTEKTPERHRVWWTTWTMHGGTSGKGSTISPANVYSAPLQVSYGLETL